MQDPPPSVSVSPCLTPSLFGHLRFLGEAKFVATTIGATDYTNRPCHLQRCLTFITFNKYSHLSHPIPIVTSVPPLGACGGTGYSSQSRSHHLCHTYPTVELCRLGILLPVSFVSPHLYRAFAFSRFFRLRSRRFASCNSVSCASKNRNPSLGQSMSMSIPSSFE